MYLIPKRTFSYSHAFKNNEKKKKKKQKEEKTEEQTKNKLNYDNKPR